MGVRYGSSLSYNQQNPPAFGGTVTEVTQGGIVYRVHTFTAVGVSTLNVVNGQNMTVLMWGAGGGKGGDSRGKSGGGGAFAQSTIMTTTGTYDISVGGGGESVPNALRVVGGSGGTGALGASGGKGGNFSSLSASGGGGGAGSLFTYQGTILVAAAGGGGGGGAESGSGDGRGGGGGQNGANGGPGATGGVAGISANTNGIAAADATGDRSAGGGGGGGYLGGGGGGLPTSDGNAGGGGGGGTSLGDIVMNGNYSTPGNSSATERQGAASGSTSNSVNGGSGIVIVRYPIGVVGQ